MATDKRYKAGSVYGSLAYDLVETAPQTEERTTVGQLEDDRRIILPQSPAKTEKREPEPRKVKSRQSIAPLAVLGLACAAVLLVFSLMARISLTEMTDQAVAFEHELTELETAQNRLLIQYESAFNFPNIEEYATGTLGMQRPRDEQIIYLETEASDKAVVIETQDQESLLDKMESFINELTEYFG